ncbi:alpha/beta hydrolase [Mesorhizobium sp. M7A.F.Ca.CA.001.04.1.1]|uniref:alpha/beta fold hydrolase n=6 Tax=Phyllobacteriaceae TaxID=69277 RepID=UPI000467B316|nr:alpha/beta hydrolase [Mesorhizobium sp. M7A.F.Ca.CA.001.13.2.1]RUZ08086.1 alpha/beta hydrolase [Mesorhizobium sp. M7A.F.Ca.CA.001.04.2.1]RUZ28758.1 alpha/beta hydrolase [Mesorhizobium sp. M7A.F.Ca.CA.001.04.1.1]RUZ38385.1 alpha/beta hydrolase [Mesorhizobium sp. M7A.F.Ca.CA.001.15.1.1]RUZ86150.1 alpha/beta hydrolase [Mesorhizobium sp. M7A.F.Ca.CA.001.14.1.1]RVA76213.1 alpha/beta hydrolase [Mesorhizobium sp. M7A.F.Ca.CA.001.11.2.1]RVB29758.1 alpha/beta hydrolase [Mesorhizobium sp. M7A.F.Ca.C
MENIAVTRTRFAQISLAMLIAISPAGASTVGPSPSKRPAAATETLVASNPAKPTIVLVHGAFADGTGWQHIIPILQRDGYTVIAVQNALTSLAEDVATTKRVIEAQKGPVVAVGHSYGGAVITGAAAGNSNVKALVYIAAFAPEAGEPIGAYTEKYPSALGSALRPDVAGFVTIDPPQFRELFANDVAAAEASVMAAAQKPIIGSAFASSVTEAAWKTIPSWYLVAQQDRAINPDLERFYAKRMGAITAEIKSSHVPFVSHPKEVARLIEQAASAPAK